MAKFKKGDKVRCIDTAWSGNEASIYPVYQGVYTVKESNAFYPTTIILEEIPFNSSNYAVWDERHFEKATESNSETMIIAKSKLKELILN